MKAIITLFFVLFIGVFANAQDSNIKLQKEVSKTEKVSDNKKVDVQNESKVARLYKFKNTKIKKELSFSTGRNKSRIA